jgi:hypothetical protein
MLLEMEHSLYQPLFQITSCLFIEIRFNAKREQRLKF